MVVREITWKDRLNYKLKNTPKEIYPWSKSGYKPESSIEDFIKDLQTFVEFVPQSDPRFKRFEQEYHALRREQVWSVSKKINDKVYNFVFI